MNNKVFECICEYCIDRKMCGFVEAVSSLEIATTLGWVRNLVKKDLKRLKELDLIKSVCESAFNECNDKYVIVRGFCVTQKGRETETYQNMLYEMSEQ